MCRHMKSLLHLFTGAYIFVSLITSVVTRLRTPSLSSPFTRASRTHAYSFPRGFSALVHPLPPLSAVVFTQWILPVRTRFGWRPSHQQVSSSLNCLSNDSLCGIYQHLLSKPLSGPVPLASLAVLVTVNLEMSCRHSS